MMYLATLLAFLGVLAATVCNAQTFSSCNPTVNISCPADPAISTPFTSDFTKGSSALTGWTTTAGSLTYDTSGSGALFTINKRGDAPTIQSTGYLFFGYVEVKMKAAAGQGIISSIVLESDDLDEVDWEFIGGTDSGVQTNYFGKGNTTTYDRMIPYNVATPQEVSHTYALNWTADSLVWLIDNVPQRTLHYADAVGGKNYPQTPMNVRIGIWAGGDPSNSAGTITWAGGPTDYTKAPFTMSVESVKIINYTPGTSYSYSDMSGSYQSIKVAGAGNPSGGVASSSTLPDAGISTGIPSASHNTSAGGGLNSIVEAGPSSTPTTFSTIPVSSAYSNGTESPCGCGVVTVYITSEIGSTPTPSPVSSLISTFIPVPTSTPLPSSVGNPVPISSITLPAVALSSAGGLFTDTHPAPIVSSTPTGGNATSVVSGVPQFTGAAGRGRVSGRILGVVGVVAAVVLL